jgi:hypothetical protein
MFMKAGAAERTQLHQNAPLFAPYFRPSARKFPHEAWKILRFARQNRGGKPCRASRKTGPSTIRNQDFSGEILQMHKVLLIGFA